MQKKGVAGLVLIVVSFLLTLNVLNNLRSRIVYLQSITDNSFLSIESENNNEKTVKCENFKLSVKMLHHPCGQTIREYSGASISVNINNSEKSIDRIKSFEKIYETAIWKSDGESNSGLGSTKYNTRQILRILNNVVDYLKSELQKDRIR